MTNPVILNDTSTLINPNDVISIRILEATLDKQFLKELSPEIRTCYVDFSFLGRANETSTKRIEGKRVVIDAKFDFLVDGKTHKEYRTKLQ